MLGIEKKLVSTYVSQGYLRRNPKNRQQVATEDVLKMRSEKALEPSLPFNKMSFALLESRVRYLETQLAIVLKTMNLAKKPLQMPNEEAAGLHSLAGIVAMGEIQLDEALWSDVLLRMDLNFLEQVEAVVHENPWLPFYKLAERAAFGAESSGMKIKLRRGLQHLRTLSGIWLESRGKIPKTADYLDDDEQDGVDAVHALLLKSRRH